MRRTAVVAALGLALLGAAPAAAADTVNYIAGQVEVSGEADGITYLGTCRLLAASNETLTGGPDTFTGVLVGAAVAYETATKVPRELDVRCLVRVDGSFVSVADDDSNTGADAVAGPTTVTASDTQTVEVCIVLGLGLGVGPECGPTTTTQVPPQPVLDLVDQVTQLTHVADFLVCPVLVSLAPGVPGVVDITPEGDVYVLGERLYDCPPYDWR